MAFHADREIRAISPNLKFRLSGVTATIARLVPKMEHKGVIATGFGLPGETPMIPLSRVFFINRSRWRIWHARRNIEMLLGLVLRHVFRRKFLLLFTSASQRQHSGYTKWLIRQMDHVISTSEKTARYLERESTVILHGIDTRPFSPVEDKGELRRRLGLPQGQLVGCYGRIRHQKGTDVFVDAMIALCKSDPKVHGIVMGNAVEKHKKFDIELRSRVREAGLLDRILFKPEVPVEQMPAWYQVLDLFVAPQRWEGFGLTPIEAMSCGVPAIATRVGAFEEIIKDGETGILVETGDAGNMADAARELLTHADRYEKMSRVARQDMLERFRLEREAEEILAVYEKMLSNVEALSQV